MTWTGLVAVAWGAARGESLAGAEAVRIVGDDVGVGLKSIDASLVAAISVCFGAMWWAWTSVLAGVDVSAGLDAARLAVLFLAVGVVSEPDVGLSRLLGEFSRFTSDPDDVPDDVAAFFCSLPKRADRPEVADAELAEVDGDDVDESAQAAPQPAKKAIPVPKATASPPVRSKYLVTSMSRVLPSDPGLHQ